MEKRKRNMCPKCETQRMVPLSIEIWICPKCDNHNLNMGLFQRKLDKMVLLNLTKKEALNMGLFQRKLDKMVLLNLTKKEADNLELALDAIPSTGGNENLQSIADKLGGT